MTIPRIASAIRIAFKWVNREAGWLNTESQVRRTWLSKRRRRREIALQIYNSTPELIVLDAYPTITLRLPNILVIF